MSAAEVYIAGGLRQTPRERWGIYEKIVQVVESLGLVVHIPHIHTINEAQTSVDNLQGDRDVLDDPARGEVFRINREVVKMRSL